eukprot:scaffold11554_cov98-Isochrysis_galbana.AAC.3
MLAAGRRRNVEGRLLDEICVALVAGRHCLVRRDGRRRGRGTQWPAIFIVTGGHESLGFAMVMSQDGI